MANFTYEQFKTEVANNIKDYLTEEYQDYNLRFQMIQKASYEYEGLMIEPKDKNGIAIPALNLTEAFKKYENGTDFDKLLYELADIRMNASLPSFNKEDIFDFDKNSEKILPSLINTAANEEYIADKPHEDIQDLSIIYRLIIDEDSKGSAVITITNQILDMWNITQKDLHKVAVENLSRTKPYLCNLGDIVFKGLNTESISIDELEEGNYDIPFFILSNQHKCRGAIMATNTAVMDRITEKLGKLYIIPSSVEEVIVAPQSAVDDVKDLARMVKSINKEAVRPEDQLSDNIYEYDIDSHSLKIAV